MKKKVIALTLCLALIAVGMLGSTLAYFKAADKEINTFTLGNVKIDLIEQQRSASGSELEEFENGKPLFPIVGSTESPDRFGLPDRGEAKNYVDKIVTVTNTGKSKAWIRCYIAIPCVFLDVLGRPALNALHWDHGKACVTDNSEGFIPDADFTPGDWYDTGGAAGAQRWWHWYEEAAPHDMRYYHASVDGVDYLVCYANYYRPLDPGETTERFVQGLYLDKTVDMRVDDRGNDVYFYKPEDGEETIAITDSFFVDGELTVKCPVFAIACQTAGFDSADEAFDEVFGADYKPW